FSDLRARLVKLVSPMAGFTEQDIGRVTNHLEERIVITRYAGKRMGRGADGLQNCIRLSREHGIRLLPLLQGRSQSQMIQVDEDLMIPEHAPSELRGDLSGRFEGCVD